jgi:DNA-binding winged helix-turn-helix (wHTH) protein
MISSHLKINNLKFIFFAFTGLLPFIANSSTPGDIEEQHLRVAMRMIGHEVLLSTGDSTSRVLPIEKDSARYKIVFESAFAFDPADLVKIINRVMKETKMTNGYLVEVEKSGTQEVVYSFEVRQSAKRDLIPCGGRLQPKDHYSLLVSVLDTSQTYTQSMSASGDHPDGSNDTTTWAGTDYYKPALITIPFLFLLGFIGYFRKKWNPVKNDEHRILVGETQFDQRKMELSFKNNTIELTSKEADLLSLLHTSANMAIERDIILQRVWGDGGDYVGRTLDVFISKLRKKLEADASVKIVNIRGVGYKLLIDKQAS